MLALDILAVLSLTPFMGVKMSQKGVLDLRGPRVFVVPPVLPRQRHDLLGLLLPVVVLVACCICSDAVGGLCPMVSAEPCWGVDVVQASFLYPVRQGAHALRVFTVEESRDSYSS